jgi:hypothetical protein
VSVESLKISATSGDSQGRERSRVFRLSIILGVVALHVACYCAVNTINSNRPASVFMSFHTIVDSWIPYIGWTSIVYYFGDFYILVIAPIIIWQLSDKKFIQAVYAYAGMIVTGALIQLILPGIAPWPNALSGTQEFVHNLIFMRPYACLPSMHVALAVLPGCILFSVTKSKWIRVPSTSMVTLISVSIVSTKEHYFLDAVAGLILALIFFAIWRNKSRA